MLATRQSVRLSCRRPLRLLAPHLRLRPARPFIALPSPRPPKQTAEEYVRTVREQWGNYLPEGLLSHAELRVYERYYGQPARMLKPGEDPLQPDEDPPPPDEAAEQQLLGAVSVDINTPREASAYRQLAQDIEGAFRQEEEQDEQEQDELDEDGEGGDELDVDDVFVRTHPLTSVGRFATFPYTIVVPPEVQLPTLESLASVPNKHLDQAAHKVLGGPGLPDSPVYHNKGGKRLRDVWLSVEDSRMSDISSEVFLAAVMPGYYAQALSALTELRRRLGGDWVLGHGDEPGVKSILDVGAGGAAVLAWKNIIAAERARRSDQPPGDIDADADAAGDPGDPAAGLRATVVSAPDSLRHRVSRFLLEDTIFLPRLPDRNPDNLFHAPGQPPTSPFTPNPKQPRRVFDLIVATNNLLPLRESHLRKKRLRELWSHLNPAGGVLLFIEKGTPLGFEAIARTRAALLASYIASPESVLRPAGGNTGLAPDDELIAKETGAIIAPCTTHSACPLFPKPHLSGGSGRRDWCRFSQRYERPSYLQRIIGADRANHADLQYSYVAVRRGSDYRRTPAVVPHLDEFTAATTDGATVTSPYSMAQLRRHAFTLPRTILSPIKRRGHVMIDVCTPAGAIERWTVPKSYGRIAFRDARKSRWGDLWALGAKTKVPRNIKIGEAGGEKSEQRKGPLKKHWSRGRNAIGDKVGKQREKKRNIRWAAQREDMRAEREEEGEERY